MNNKDIHLVSTQELMTEALSRLPDGVVIESNLVGQPTEIIFEVTERPLGVTQSEIEQILYELRAAALNFATN